MFLQGFKDIFVLHELTKFIGSVELLNKAFFLTIIAMIVKSRLNVTDSDILARPKRAQAAIVRASSAASLAFDVLLYTG